MTGFLRFFWFLFVDLRLARKWRRDESLQHAAFQYDMDVEALERLRIARSERDGLARRVPA